MNPTIGETIRQLHQALQDYIEATYHISHPKLIALRKQLLQEEGVIHQRPYLESTPRYKIGAAFKDLGLDAATQEILSEVTRADNDLGLLVHDPPFHHQAEALRRSLVDGRSLVVMTGTGSGKTECFLLPILGKLAREAKSHGPRFGATPAVRAILLYPMNALVNDQLGRLRLLLGDPRVVKRFVAWSGRPARFARYTSRTLYPGVRTEKKDQDRLRPIEKYYVRNLELAQGPASPEQAAAARFVAELRSRGKWPSKPNLIAWYGKKGSRWKDASTGSFRRCVTLPGDPELFTRHEVHEAPPDILITNYSMLEYMLMRPLERPVFDRTKEWLRDNPNESFLLVIDEAHLYRGAAGAEVALLVRRLRTRLGIPAERLQVICTSASFGSSENAARFGAQLAGKDLNDFDTIRGEFLVRSAACSGTVPDAEALGEVDLRQLYEAESDDARLPAVAPFLRYRGAQPPWELRRSLYEGLVSFGPMAHLINLTMKEARPLRELAGAVFEGVEAKLAARALTSLVALGSLARPTDSEPGLLPCRVHSFYRGLPGLWVCIDPQCSALQPDERGGPTGKLYSQPRDSCECGARVLELYTCRNCGSAYARAYTNDVKEPDFLWGEPGGAFRTLAGAFDELEPLDLLLEEPVVEVAEPAEYDLVTGRLNPQKLGPRNRRVFLRANRVVPPGVAGDQKGSRPGEFRPCAVCGETAAFGRSSVQDMQTKGDQPFQALIAKQIQVQAPSRVKATRLAPLRGRKVLVFSDSRQTAARLAPNLQDYSTQDTLRPLIILGFSWLARVQILEPILSLADVYLGVLLAAQQLGVRLRPELKTGESFQDEELVGQAVKDGVLSNDKALQALLIKLRPSRPPQSLLKAITKCLVDRYYGLESLALASIVETSEHSAKIDALPDLPGFAYTSAQKLAVVRAWLRCWKRVGFWLSGMPPEWWLNEVRPHSGKFEAMQRFLHDSAIKRLFEEGWLPTLLKLYCEQLDPGKFRLKGVELSLQIGGSWAYCSSCRTTQRPFPGRRTCLNCGQDTADRVDPDSDPVFSARKGYYRASTNDALKVPPIAPIALVAAEHTAQLNTAQAEEVFSKAEEHELLFQDVELGPDEKGRERPAIDVLSCTTTMEVGIDIGTLSGVSLRNMPPSRANYQQRAGRAGRRGNAVASVTAFGSADSHDEHYFTNPDLMIRGAVDDPRLTLDNRDIARRHITAFLLQRYYGARLPAIRPEEQPSLFEVLGKVGAFRDSRSVLNRTDLETWLRENQEILRREVDSWLPVELSQADREGLLSHLIEETLEPIDKAIEFDALKVVASAGSKRPAGSSEEEPEATAFEAQEEPDEARSGRDPASENLLDRLLYKGVLPRYAFPTDVATFHVFEPERSTRFRAAFRFTPSQGLPIALSEYAPGKEVWIGGKLWTSGAIYSTMHSDIPRAWQAKRLYYECRNCHFARTLSVEEGRRGEERDCEACGGLGTFGPGTYWFRPPGFAHPVSKPEGTSPDDQPAKSYATRAKLTAPTPADSSMWTKLNNRIRVHYTRQHLLVTNRGPRTEGYTYCTKCGLIEPTALPHGEVGTAHRKPYPDPREANCPGGGAVTGLVLGTDFITDVLLISLAVEAPAVLLPGLIATDVALRTLCEALAKAACTKLELEPSELQAEYRAALTAQGRDGKEAEIYLYDTLPGGAGFAQRVGGLGLAVFEEALEILENCPDHCDRSCYRCLRSYKNKFEHDLLDRQLGASLLRFLLTGAEPKLEGARIQQATDVLCQDLERQGLEGLTIERNVIVRVPGMDDKLAPILVTGKDGMRLVVALYGPLTPDEPHDEGLRELRDVSANPRLHLVDELVVRKNLPRATADLISVLAQWEGQ
jgi:ATP-dependent helicase YprA (DUF1998 family)